MYTQHLKHIGEQIMQSVAYDRCLFYAPHMVLFRKTDKSG